MSSSRAGIFVPCFFFFVFVFAFRSLFLFAGVGRAMAVAVVDGARDAVEDAEGGYTAHAGLALVLGVPLEVIVWF